VVVPADYTSTVLSDISVIQFVGLEINPLSATFYSLQFDNLSILNSVLFIGRLGSDAIVVNFSPIYSPDARLWTFSSWTAGQDTITFNGSNVADELFGSTQNDTMYGFDGDDVFVGGRGDDIIDGGNGVDIVYYDIEESAPVGGVGTHGVIVNLSSIALSNVSVMGIPTTNVGAGRVIDTFGFSDQLASIQEIVATNFDDLVVGGSADEYFEGLSGSDRIFGGDGNDSITGDDGADFLFGGNGNDLLFFDADQAPEHGVIVNLSDSVLIGVSVDGISLRNVAAHSAVDGFGFVDNIVSFERVQGTGYNDILVGDNDGNEFVSSAGHDEMRGGSGRDRASYAPQRGGSIPVHGVIVNLSDDDLINVSINGLLIPTFVEAGTAVDEFTDIDFLDSLEDVKGSGFDDYIVGSDSFNELEGNSGADLIYGNGGNDMLDGGTGNDRMYGGAGDDIYVVDSAGDVVSESGGGGFDTVRTSLSGYTLGAGLERLEFIGSTAFYGFGDIGVNQLLGGLGADGLYAGAGDDYLEGNDGADALAGGTGDDDAFGGNGADILLMDDYTDAGRLISNGADYAEGGAGDDLVWGFGGNDELYGGVDNDTLVGNDFTTGPVGFDALYGGDGNDKLYLGYGGTAYLDGGAGNDTLYGYIGSDTLRGGLGNDFMYGNLGADFFQFYRTDLASGNADIVYFVDAGDRLKFSADLNGSLFFQNLASLEYSPGLFTTGVYITAFLGGGLTSTITVYGTTVAALAGQVEYTL
jgi:Ca2+-binding RTX toxin-like protein